MPHCSTPSRQCCSSILKVSDGHCTTCWGWMLPGTPSPSLCRDKALFLSTKHLAPGLESLNKCRKGRLPWRCCSDDLMAVGAGRMDWTLIDYSCHLNKDSCLFFPQHCRHLSHTWLGSTLVGGHLQRVRLAAFFIPSPHIRSLTHTALLKVKSSQSSDLCVLD